MSDLRYFEITISLIVEDKETALAAYSMVDDLFEEQLSTLPIVEAGSRLYEQVTLQWGEPA